MAMILLTGGATRNPIDATRYVSAGASGETAILLGNILGRTHLVRMLGSAEANLRARLAGWGVPGDTRQFLPFGSTRDLEALMRAQTPLADVVVHSAAVGDYEAPPLLTKIPSQRPELVVRMTPAPKILDQIRAWAPHAFLASFKAGSPEWTAEELEGIARAQLVRTDSNVVFANLLGQLESSCMLVQRESAQRYATRAEAVSALGELLDAAAAQADIRLGH